MRVVRALAEVIEAFERLPGIGPKTAQRLGYYLLHVPQAELDRFASVLSDLKRLTVECSICHNVAETDPCDICTDSQRDKALICVLAQPLEVVAMERGAKYRGVYHVLHGTIDPLHNIGPEEIKIGELVGRLTGNEEIVLALNPDMEGEATCLYIKRMLKDKFPQLRITRLANGLPVGADIEYADEVTLNHALEGRKDY